MAINFNNMDSGSKRSMVLFGALSVVLVGSAVAMAVLTAGTSLPITLALMASTSPAIVTGAMGALAAVLGVGSMISAFFAKKSVSVSDTKALETVEQTSGTKPLEKVEQASGTKPLKKVEQASDTKAVKPVESQGKTTGLFQAFCSFFANTNKSKAHDSQNKTQPSHTTEGP